MTAKSFLAFVIFPFAALLVLIGCSDEDTYPVTPEIEFKSLEKFTKVSGSDSVVLAFSFTDGDGDLGAPSGDTVSRDIYVTLFEMQNGTFVEFPDPFNAFNYRLPYLEPRGNNKSLKGDIRINVDYNTQKPNDTIRYDVYIRDRAGHQSNTVSSTTLITRVE